MSRRGIGVLAAALAANMFAGAAHGGSAHAETEPRIAGIERLTNRDKRVSVKLKDVPALKVLQAISTAGGFTLTHEGLADCCVMRLSVKNVTVREALEAVAAKALGAEFEIVDADTVRVHRSAVALPLLLTKAEPVYPKDAKDARIEGHVIVQAVVQEDGTVSEIRVLKGIPDWPSLDAAAIASVEKRTYRPGTRDGVPIAVVATIKVDFRLK